MEDFRDLMTEQIGEERRAFDWSHPVHDTPGNYIVDCRVNGTRRPLFVFALPGDDRVRDATISILQFERWGTEFRSMGIFEDQEQINRKVLARFSDTCEKQFSSLTPNRERISNYLEEAMESGRTSSS